MPLDAKKIALLHVAKKQLGLDDATWHLLLARAAGVESSKNLNHHGFSEMCAALEALGWKSNFGKAHGGNLRHWDKATVGQIAKIKDLWTSLHDGELDEAALDKWLSRFGADSLRFFDRQQGRRAIAGLLSWHARVAARADREAS